MKKLLIPQCPDSLGHTVQKEKDNNVGEEDSDKLSETLLYELNTLKSEINSDSENNLSTPSEVAAKICSNVVEVLTRNNNIELNAKLGQIIKAQDSLKIAMQNQTTLLELFKEKTEVSLNSLVQRVCETVEREEVDGQLIHNLLPLTTKEQIDEMEEKIHLDLQYRRNLVRKLSNFGGVNGAKTIRNIAKCLFTDLLLTQFSWQGTVTKKNFNQYTNIFAAILDAVRERYPSYSYAEGSNFFKVYLKQARFRLGKTLDETADVDVTMNENSNKN